MNVVRFILLSFTILFAGNAVAERLPLRVLIVLSNTAQVPGSDRPTGVWASEYTDPYEIFTKAGYEVHVASPKGGKSSVDPRSGSEDSVKRIPSAWQKMQNTKPLAELKVQDYAAVFLAGGHGTMWDFPNDPNLSRMVSEAIATRRLVGAVCHGPAGLIGATTADGKSLLAGRKVNSFTNAEERAAGMSDIVPFLLEDRLRQLGGKFESGAVFQQFVVEDVGLITGQNPASAEAVANRMLLLLKGRAGP
jgi:putative intracellular protease/amidase